MPEVTRYVADLTDDKAKEEAEEAVGKCNQERGTYRGYVVLCECGNDAGEDERGNGEVHGDLRGTLGRNLGKKVFSSKTIANEHGEEAVGQNSVWS